MNFEAMLDEVAFDQANVAVPAGLNERLLERLWAKRIELKMTQVMNTHVSESRPFDGLRAGYGAPGAVAVDAAVLRFDTVLRVRAGRSARSAGVAVLLHLAALLLIGAMVRSGERLATSLKVAGLTEMRVPSTAAPKASAMGGGGGQRGPEPVSKGAPPKVAEVQVMPPKAPPMVAAKIAVEPTVEVQKEVKMAADMPNFGVPNSPVIGMALGGGRGTGLGSGSGAGIGPGSSGNTGGGPRRIGGGVSAPQVLFSVVPEFSEAARRAKVSGNVVVHLWVDERGNPSHVRVLRGVGMGLDDKAVEAVTQYKFRPAMENGRPVLVELNIEVNFQIF